MPIVSISMDAGTLAELAQMEKSLGFSGRSEAVRAGMRALIAETKSAESLSGRINAVMLLVHEERAEGSVIGLKHDYDDVIGTQIHSHLEGEKCLEVFILDGEAGRIRELYRMAQSTKRIEYAKLIVP